MEKLSICLIHEEYPPETGGAGIGTYQATMAKALANLGHKVIVIAKAVKKSKIEVNAGVEVHRIKSWIRTKGILGMVAYRLRIKRYLRQLLHERKIDIIESPEWGGETVFLKNLPHRPPVVIRLHGSSKVIRYYNQGHYYISTWLQEWFEKKCIRQADLITSPTKTLIGETQKLLNILLAKVKVIPNPVSREALENQIKPIVDDNQLILYVGRISFIKGIPVLIRSIPLILDKFPGAHFRLVGRCGINTRKKFVGQIDKKYHDRISFTGPMSYEKVLSSYQESVLCVFPSFFEAFGLVVIEALAAGRPVVLSKIGSFMEIVADGKEGLFFEPGDPGDLAEKVVTLLSNRNMLMKMQGDCIKKAQDFSPLKIVKLTLEEYYSLL
jgi:glycosyltransferase involved in cell wall biosynthesis